MYSNRGGSLKFPLSQLPACAPCSRYRRRHRHRNRFTTKLYAAGVTNCVQRNGVKFPQLRQPGTYTVYQHGSPRAAFASPRRQKRRSAHPVPLSRERAGPFADFPSPERTLSAGAADPPPPGSRRECAAGVDRHQTRAPTPLASSFSSPIRFRSSRYQFNPLPLPAPSAPPAHRTFFRPAVLATRLASQSSQQPATPADGPPRTTRRRTIDAVKKNVSITTIIIIIEQ